MAKIVKKRSLFNDAMNRFKKDKVAVISLFIIFAIVICSFVIPAIFYSSTYYSEINLYNTSQAPTWSHWFGTDQLGRDIFVRVLVGGQTSIEIALVATVVSVSIGTLYGAIAGFVGGKIDSLMMRFVDGLYALPFLFFIVVRFFRTGS